MGTNQTLPTLWEIPDDLWEKIEPILNRDDPPKKTGRPKADRRKALNGIIFRMRTSVQWNKLPHEFGDDSTVHRYFQRWSKNGIFKKIWAMLVKECEQLGAVDWQWQSADGALGKARFGGIKWEKIPQTGLKTAQSAVFL